MLLLIALDEAVLDGRQFHPQPSMSESSLPLQGLLEVIVQPHELAMEALQRSGGG